MNFLKKLIFSSLLTLSTTSTAEIILYKGEPGLTNFDLHLKFEFNVDDFRSNADYHYFNRDYASTGSWSSSETCFLYGPYYDIPKDSNSRGVRVTAYVDIEYAMKLERDAQRKATREGVIIVYDHSFDVDMTHYSTGILKQLDVKTIPYASKHRREVVLHGEYEGDIEGLEIRICNLKPGTYVYKMIVHSIEVEIDTFIRPK